MAAGLSSRGKTWMVEYYNLRTLCMNVKKIRKVRFKVISLFLKISDKLND